MVWEGDGKRERERAMAEEAQVITCQSTDHWKELLDKAKEAKKLVVVDFTALWCGPCRFIAPILAGFAKKFPHVVFVKVDVDEQKAIAEEWKVEAMPTFAFVKDGQEIERIVGANKDGLLAAITKHASETVNA